MTTTAHPENVHPLSEYYSEWRRVCLMDEQADGQRVVYTLQFASPPAVQQDTGNNPVIPGTVSHAPFRAAGTLVKKSLFPGFLKGKEISGFYSRYFLVPKETGQGE